MPYALMSHQGQEENGAWLKQITYVGTDGYSNNGTHNLKMLDSTKRARFPNMSQRST